MPMSQYPARRLLQLLHGRLLRSARGPLERKWRQQIAKFTDGYYRESNRVTGDLIGIDLGRYGYEVENGL